MQEFGMYNLALVGDYGVGKRSYIKRLITGEFSECSDFKDVPEIQNLIFNTVVGSVYSKIQFATSILEPKDLSTEKFNTVIKNADCVIVMLSSKSEVGYETGCEFRKKIFEISPLIPIVFINSKCDTEIFISFDLMEMKSDKFAFYNVSTKNNHRIYLPFYFLARSLTGEPTLDLIKFVEKDSKKESKADIIGKNSYFDYMIEAEKTKQEIEKTKQEIEKTKRQIEKYNNKKINKLFVKEN